MSLTCFTYIDLMLHLGTGVLIYPLNKPHIKLLLRKLT